MSEVNIRHIKDFIGKHAYYLNRENKPFFYGASIGSGILFLVTMQSLYSLLDRGMDIPFKFLVTKNIILVAVVLFLFWWVYYHLQKEQTYQTRYETDEHILSWYTLYKQYRSGLTKHKDTDSILIRKIEEVDDTFREHNRLLLTGTTLSQPSVVKKFYVYEDVHRPYLMPNMTVDVSYRENIAYSLSPAKQREEGVRKEKRA